MVEKLKLNFLLSLFITGSLFGCNGALAAVAPPQAKPPVVSQYATQTVPISPVQPQKVEFENCNKNFKIDSQKLFYLTLSAINANRFTIDEIQSNSGYALFSVGLNGQRQFLASVVAINSQNSLLKITPCNNSYFFPIGIVQNMFRYIELNINTPIEKLPIL